MASYRICLCFSDTGGGHRSAAEAIETALREVAAKELPGISVDIFLDNLAEKTHPINRWFVDLYNYLLRYHQAWMKYYTWFIEESKPNDSALGYWLAEKYVKEVFQRERPSVVVSVHPMVNHYLARAMKELGMSPKDKLITVITDPNSQLWSGWACKDADTIIAPNDLAFNRLVELGIDPRRIKTIGMPIQPQFLRPPKVERQELLTSLGLEPARLTICITAGWAGGGNMVEVYRVLASVAERLQVIVVCGHNQELLEEIKHEAASSTVNTVVLPYLESMSDLMASCDLLVTKAGGLTTFEAIARHLPMAIDLLTEPMPQEAGTAEMLIEQNLAKPLYKPTDIVHIIESLDRDPEREKKPLPSAHGLDQTDAVYGIARTILYSCDPGVGSHLMPEATPQTVEISPAIAHLAWEMPLAEPLRLEAIPEVE